MSRVGKVPVMIADGVKVERQGQTLVCTGPKGTLECLMLPNIEITQEASQITFSPKNGAKQTKANWGLARAQLANMVKGVSEGWTKELEIRGVGFRAAVQGKVLKLNLGFSHDVDYPIPEGIVITCAKPTSILISGIDKQKIGQIAAEIRSYRSPEPYKGKGVRYVGEYVLQKEGKKK